MPKLKTHKGVKRRVTMTGTGLLRHFRSGRRHLLSSKSANQTRRMRRQSAVAAVDQTKLRRLLPYQ